MTRMKKYAKIAGLISTVIKLVESSMTMQLLLDHR